MPECKRCARGYFSRGQKRREHDRNQLQCLPDSQVAIDQRSELTNVLAEIAAVNDQAALRRASQRVDATVTKVESCMLASFTEQAFLARCSSEWKQFHFSDGSSSRTHMANILNLDESYRFLRMLGLIAGNAKNGDGSELASELNRINWED